jgi:hypothetical protein
VKKLRVVVDGEPMSENEARAFWARFSAHMEAHRGDLGGFAQAEGLASVHPEVQGGTPVLMASRSSPQRAYANAPVRTDGSNTDQAGALSTHSARHGASKKHKKPR